MAQHNAIEKARPAPPVATELDPGEFGLALATAATWFFLGPWGIVPTVVFVYKIVGARAPTITRVPGVRWLDEQLGLAQLREDWPELRQRTPREMLDYALGREVAAPAARALEPAQAAMTNAPLFGALEQRPHRLVIGHTGGGKTTLLHDRATSWAASGQRVYVCDPDAAPGQWPGCIVAGGGDDYGAVEQVLLEVGGEFRRRSLARSQGTRQFAPLHLVIDEAQETIGQVEGAWEVLEPVVRRGRKLGMHLTLGVQDDQVGTLDLEGRSHLLKNLVTMELYQEPDGQRVAVVKDRIGGRALQTLAVPQLRDPESLIVQTPATGTTQLVRRPARSSAAARAVPDELLAGLLASAVPAHQGAEGTVVTPIPGNGSNGAAGHSSVTVEGGAGGAVTVNATLIAPGPATKDKAARTAYERALVELYRAAGAEGLTFAKAYAQHKGTKEIVFTAWQEGRATREGK